MVSRATRLSTSCFHPYPNIFYRAARLTFQCNVVWTFLYMVYPHMCIGRFFLKYSHFSCISHCTFCPKALCSLFDLSALCCLPSPRSRHRRCYQKRQSWSCLDYWCESTSISSGWTRPHLPPMSKCFLSSNRHLHRNTYTTSTHYP